MSLDPKAPEQEGGPENPAPVLLDGVVGIRIRRLQALFSGHWQSWFRARGLVVTPVQGGVLLLIRHHPGISQIALARRLRIEPPTLLQSLTPLVNQGLVERDRSAEDGRVYELRLTQAGSEAAAMVETSTPKHEADLLRALSFEERQAFLALLDKAIAGAETAIDEPGAGIR
ncbi:MarR family winged helix-turn-helix transcriptional regulator [Rhizobium sp. XQZ8]|uniref:MarR family winged helix-turn-helix transcriptional regulator n=1 Tax=Rhizobium populisoli TaxID=2859785 RepID=UPI001C677A34|nr:MarR family winged helix-turn-helix transcriptional regulator [Rhizobium populisoli]MBW6422546.1 MarR family winged helix-turn-helix transcriptional regulator [Rhizobium populisoli]